MIISFFVVFVLYHLLSMFLKSVHIPRTYFNFFYFIKGRETMSRSDVTVLVDWA